MKALVFGSFNIDKVYKLPRLPEKGETLYCDNYEIHVGGKGLNQALALAKAGADAVCGGCVGEDGDFLVDFLAQGGVDTSRIKKVGGYTGHAIISVDGDGQNQMILFPGSNHAADEEYCDSLLEGFSVGDLVLMEYETSCVDYMIRKSREKGLTVALNPSPFVDKIKDLPLSMVDYLVLNEYEGECLSGLKDPRGIAEKLLGTSRNVLLTLGADGSLFYGENGEREFCPAFKVNAADTTGAGDTYTGYFLAGLLSGKAPRDAMREASAASALVCSRVGAAESIPSAAEVAEFLR